MDLVYLLSEQSLASAVDDVSDLNPTAPGSRRPIEEAGLKVFVIRGNTNEFVGWWGPIPESIRNALARDILSARPGEIAETEALSELGLSCAHFDLEPPVDSEAENKMRETLPTREAIACQRAADLVDLRREIGVGPLLREVARRGVIYAAIQDKSGILASSSNLELSSWKNDAAIERALDKNNDELSFRLISTPGSNRRTQVFEGLGRFAMPDGTSALLRVGVDASYLVAARAEIDSRHRVLLLLVSSVFLLSVLGASLIGRWDRRRERAEQQLAAREQESRWLQLMAQMSATVAHEVRSPLNTVKMIAQRLTMEFDLPGESRKEYRELVDMLRGEADRVDKVVSDFVEIGRPIVLALETLAFSEAVEQALLPLRLRVSGEGNKKLWVETSPDGLVRIDRRRFGQIVYNLVSNALDAVNQTGTVRVVARWHKDGLHLLVEDDGEGMTAKQLEQAQRPFVTTKAKGTGLGLPLAIRLAEAHRGRLTLSSIPGRGTRAELFIPSISDNR
jgi:signal transduction histidine kinase